jgi:hypothetical protein
MSLLDRWIVEMPTRTRPMDKPEVYSTGHHHNTVPVLNFKTAYSISDKKMPVVS